MFVGRVCVIWIAAIAVACEARELREGGAIAVDTVGGVEQVRNPAGSPLWSITEVTRLGAAEGPASFGRIGSIVADEQGNVYVADRQASEIRVFDASGAHVRTFGRRGQGPGEFISLYSLAWMGDTLMVLDPGNSRIGLVSATGDWRGQLPHEPLTGSDLHLIPAGSDVYTMGTGGAGPDGRLETHYVRFTGGTMDTIPYRRTPPAAGEHPVIICRRTADGSMTFFSQPFRAGDLYEPAPGRLIATATTARYRVALIDSIADTVRVIEKAMSPPRITDAEWDSATTELPDWRERFPDASCDGTSFTRPEAKPVIQDLFFDRAGWMWVEVTSTDSSTFDVFDERGRQVGRVVTPKRLRRVPVYATGDRMYIVVADSLGVEEVRVFRLGLEPR